MKSQLEKSILEKSTQKRRKETANEEEISPTKKESPTKTENSEQYAAMSAARVHRNVLEKHLNREEMVYADKLLKEEKPMEQILIETAAKLESLERHFEEARMSRGVLTMVQRDIEKFERYETYEQRYDRHEKKIKAGDKTTTKEGEMRSTTKDGDFRTTARETEGRQTANPSEADRASAVPNLTLKDSRKLGTSRKVIAVNEETRNEEDQPEPDR